MSPLTLLVRRGLKQNWVGWVFVSLLTALTITSVGGTVTVARLTLTAYPRLLDAIDAPDVTIGIGSPDDPGPPTPIAPAELSAVDGIEELRIIRLIFGTEVDAQGEPDLTFRTGIGAAVEGTPALPLLRGRWPADDSPDEVAISAGAVEFLGADLGDHFPFIVATVVEQEITTIEPLVVGVFGPAAVDGPADAPTSSSMIITSRAFLEAHPGIGQYQSASVWLDDDTTLDSFVRSLEDRFGSVDVSTRTQAESNARRAVEPEAFAVLGLGVALALAGLIVTALAIARQMNDGSDELSYLALGLARRQRALQRWAQALLAIVLGTTIGFAGSLAASDALGPIGIADAFDRSTLETSDVAVALGTGFAVALLLASLAGVSSWRNSRIAHQLPPAATPPAWVAAIIGAAPMELRTGAALASRGTGAHRAVRAAVIGTATSVVISVGVIMFASSLDALVSNPARYGSDYDLAAWDGYGRIDDDTITAALTGDADVADISRAAGSTGTVDGREAGLTGFDNFAIGPLLTSGRQPTADDEVILGRRLARRLDVGIGEDVTVVVGDARESYRVVGLGVLPESTGDGAAFTLEGIHRVSPDAQVGFQYVRLQPHADPDLVIQHYGEALGCSSDCDIVAPAPPLDLAYLDRVGDLPRWSVAAVILLGVAMSINALLIVGRRSRRAIAILRSIGATRRQVTRYLLGQSMIIVVIAVGAGVVVGVLIGRYAWSRFADKLGVVPQAASNPAAIAISVAVLVIITTAASAIPAWRTANRPVAPELRAD